MKQLYPQWAILFLLAISKTPLWCTALNPSEVEMKDIGTTFKKPLKDEGQEPALLQEFSHVEIVQDTERTRFKETQEKEEKDRERWKAKYLTVEDNDIKGGGGGGGEGRTLQDTEFNGRTHQDASHKDPVTPPPPPTPRVKIPDSLRGKHPSSRSSGAQLGLEYYANFLNFYLPDSSLANPDCKRDLHALDQGVINIEEWIREGEIWPLRMIDSWGKTADGILDGNFNLMGFFKECVGVNVLRERIPKADFTGKYCSIIYYHRPVNDSLGHMHASRRPLKSTMIYGSSSSIPATLYATCMPSSCTEKEMRETLVETFNQTLYELKYVNCQTENQHHDLTGGEIFGIIFFSLIGILLLSASVIDIWAEYYPYESIRRGPLRYILVFSVPFNIQKLFHIETGRNPHVISCLHGMRFLSICWVVLGHQYGFSPLFSSNIVELPELAGKVAFQMISNADVSVDTFFFMSGVLVALTFFRHMRNTRKFNLPLYILHRVVRLLPPIAILCAFLATLSSFLVKGPLSWWYKYNYVKGCRHSWWMDLTFFSNFIYLYLDQMNKKDESASCIPHGWFISVDMQLYLITPLILLPMFFWEKRGLILLSWWCAASVIIPASIIGFLHLWPSTMVIQDPAASLEYTHKIYTMPWCRAGPYIVGIAIGYVLYLAKDSPSITRLSKFQVIIGWLATTAVALSIIFGIAKYNKVKVPGTPPVMSWAEAVLYGGFHRAVWGVVLGWIVLACHWGYGGPINWFLSHPLWQPLSKLTYCIYLTSVPIQLALLTSNVRPTYYDNIKKIEETCGVLLITFIFSVALTLIAEAPILRLEKMLLYPSSQNSGATVSTRELNVAIDIKSDSEDSSSEHISNDGT